jgi:superoxide dismutase
MRKEYIVVRIDAAPDGSPYIFVSLVEPKDMKEKPQSPFGVQVISSFTSLEDLMKNINRMIASQMVGGFTTTLKLSMKEYEESGIKVGDKIYLEIIKADIPT